VAGRKEHASGKARPLPAKVAAKQRVCKTVSEAASTGSNPVDRKGSFLF